MKQTGPKATLKHITLTALAVAGLLTSTHWMGTLVAADAMAEINAVSQPPASHDVALTVHVESNQPFASKIDEAPAPVEAVIDEVESDETIVPAMLRYKVTPELPRYFTVEVYGI